MSHREKLQTDYRFTCLRHVDSPSNFCANLFPCLSSLITRRNTRRLNELRKIIVQSHTNWFQLSSTRTDKPCGLCTHEISFYIIWPTRNILIQYWPGSHVCSKKVLLAKIIEGAHTNVNHQTDEDEMYEKTIKILR